MSLPAGWPEQRDLLHRIATHLLARARHQDSGRFSLEPAPGGFATPTFVTADGSYRRLRVAATAPAMLVDERIGPAGASTHFLRLEDTTLAALADGIGVRVDADFSVGHDTPEIGEPQRPIRVDPTAVSAIGDWYAFGSVAIDRSVTAHTSRTDSVARIWPEHFDLGSDVEVTPGRRCNLGASPGDASYPDPYLYVGPWGDERPGDRGYWNAPFGAVLGYDALSRSDEPLLAATDFFRDGIRRLGA